MLLYGGFLYIQNKGFYLHSDQDSVEWIKALLSFMGQERNILQIEGDLSTALSLNLKRVSASSKNGDGYAWACGLNPQA